MTAEDIYQQLKTDPKHDGFVIQERLLNHREITDLTGVDHLQGVRITTLVGHEDRAKILHAHFKFVVGDNVADNFGGGSTGNLQSRVDLKDGRLNQPITIISDQPGICPVPSHPKTHINVAGVQLPFWREACDLVLRAAPLFLPVRTVGWDVALTPNGPVIVEGNMWWNPVNQHQNMGEILRILEDEDGHSG